MAWRGYLHPPSAGEGPAPPAWSVPPWDDLFGLSRPCQSRPSREIYMPPSLSSDAAGVGVEYAVFERLRIDFAVVPIGSFRRAMQPLQMILIDGIFDHLKEIAVDRTRPSRAHAVFSG